MIRFYNKAMIKGTNYPNNKIYSLVIHRKNTSPPQSLDLNSTELVQNKLDRKVKAKQLTSAPHQCTMQQECLNSRSLKFSLLL